MRRSVGANRPARSDEDTMLANRWNNLPWKPFFLFFALHATRKRNIIEKEIKAIRTLKRIVEWMNSKNSKIEDRWCSRWISSNKSNELERWDLILRRHLSTCLPVDYFSTHPELSIERSFTYNYIFNLKIYTNSSYYVIYSSIIFGSGFN